MKLNVWMAVLALGVVWTAGCASSSSKRDVVLADLMRDMQAQDANAPVADSRDQPDAPMQKPPAVGSAETPVQSASNFQPFEQQSPPSGALTIQADSVLRITVEEDPGLSGSYPVNELGGISLGYIGPVILENLTEQTAAQKLRNILLAREFHTATVAVKILRPSYDKVSIAGAVRRPGIIKVGAGDEVSLNSALNQAGGIIDTPWQTQVKVVRGGLTSTVAAYLPGEVYSLADESGNPRVPEVKLRNNDVAFVYAKRAQRSGKMAEQPRWILVLGEVTAPGFHRFEPDERLTMMNLIFRIGGLPAYANDKEIRVIREDKDGISQEFRVNARQIMEEGDPELDFALQSGDRVIVPARKISLF